MTSTDYSYSNPPKERIRERNIDTALRGVGIYSRKNQALRCDWIELPGDGAPTLHRLVKRRLLAPGYKFIGVDLDETVLARCQHEHRLLLPELMEWRRGELITLIRSDRHIWPNAGVLNYDSFRHGDGRLLPRDLETLLDFAQRRQHRVGEFLLILNVVARTGVDRARHRMQHEFEKLLGWAPADAAFEAYVSEGKRNAMLNLRLCLGGF